jgi:hypothetical protein
MPRSCVGGKHAEDERERGKTPAKCKISAAVTAALKCLPLTETPTQLHVLSPLES